MDHPGKEIDEVELDRLLVQSGSMLAGSDAVIPAQAPINLRTEASTSSLESAIRAEMALPENQFKNGSPKLTKMAQALKMDRHTLARKLKELRIDKRVLG
jgi:DNA-binding NtrC family response regulator